MTHPSAVPHGLVEQVRRHGGKESALLARGVDLGPDLVVWAHGTRLHLEADPTSAESITEVIVLWMHDPGGDAVPSAGTACLLFLDYDLKGHPDCLRDLAALFVDCGPVILPVLAALPSDALLPAPGELLPALRAACTTQS